MDNRSQTFVISVFQHQVGLQVTLPIRNRTARAQAGIAETNKKQSQTQQQKLEMTADSDVRNTLQQLINSDLSLRASSELHNLLSSSSIASNAVQAGTSSVFLVLQRQTELVNAKLREIRATADRGEAEADLIALPQTHFAAEHRVEVCEFPKVNFCADRHAKIQSREMSLSGQIRD